MRLHHLPGLLQAPTLSPSLSAVARCTWRCSEREAPEEPPLTEEELMAMKVPWMLQFASDLRRKARRFWREVWGGKRWRVFLFLLKHAPEKGVTPIVTMVKYHTICKIYGHVMVVFGVLMHSSFVQEQVGLTGKTKGFEQILGISAAKILLQQLEQLKRARPCRIPNGWLINTPIFIGLYKSF